METYGMSPIYIDNKQWSETAETLKPLRELNIQHFMACNTRAVHTTTHDGETLTYQRT